LDAIKDPLYSKIINRLEALEEFPEMGVAMIGPFAGYRAINPSPHRIVYRLLSGGAAEIAYIRHCGRNGLEQRLEFTVW